MEREMGLAGFGWDRVPPVKMVGLISEHRPNNSAGHDDDVKCFDGDAIGDAIGRRANGDDENNDDADCDKNVSWFTKLMRMIVMKTKIKEGVRIPVPINKKCSFIIWAKLQFTV